MYEWLGVNMIPRTRKFHEHLLNYMTLLLLVRHSTHPRLRCIGANKKEGLIINQIKTKQMNNLKGRKIKGFKFEGSAELVYIDSMDDKIGEVGEIKNVYSDSVEVIFNDDCIWRYPLDQIEKHLIPEENEIPELGEGVLMEVSDCEDFEVSYAEVVIGSYIGLFLVGESTHISYWKYARPIKEKVVLTHKQIADKFNIDINQLEIEK